MELFSDAISQFNIQDALNAMTSFVTEAPVEQSSFQFTRPGTRGILPNINNVKSSHLRNAASQPLPTFSNSMSAEDALRRLKMEERRKEQRRRMMVAASSAKYSRSPQDQGKLIHRKLETT